MNDIPSLSLKTFLDAHIYDGQFSGDVDLNFLKEKYIKDLSDGCFDIVKKDMSVLIGHSLKWDSAYFGFSCYRIVYISNHGEDFSPEHIYNFLRDKKVRLAFLRLNTKAPSRLNLCQHPSFKLCATKVMYKQSLQELPLESEKWGHSFDVLANMPEKIKQRLEREIQRIAPSLFKINHFASDSKIGQKKAVGLYREWTRDIIKNRPGDIFCLSNGTDKLCAFSVIRNFECSKKKIVLLELIGTLVSGKNYGFEILKKLTLQLARDRNEVFLANTDLRNYPAHKLFCQNGFILYNSIDEYHCWIEK